MCNSLPSSVQGAPRLGLSPSHSLWHYYTVMKSISQKFLLVFILLQRKSIPFFPGPALKEKTCFFGFFILMKFKHGAQRCVLCCVCGLFRARVGRLKGKGHLPTNHPSIDLVQEPTLAPHPLWLAVTFHHMKPPINK